MNNSNASNYVREMIEYYNRRAPWHDDYMSFNGFPAMEKLLRPIIDTIAPYVTNKDILEIACGTGNWTGLISQRAKSVLAGDSSERSLDIAGRKLKDIKNITLREFDAFNLDTGNLKFDTIFAADWYSHIPNSSTIPFLQTLIPLLRLEGTIIIHDIIKIPEIEKDYFATDEDGNRLYKRSLPDGSEFMVIKNYPTREDLKNISQSLGLNLEYYFFEELKRWLAIFQKRA